MKIGINGRFLTKPYTGIGQYTKNLFAYLAEIDPKNEYVLVVPEVVGGGRAMKGAGMISAEAMTAKKTFPANVQIKVLKEKRFPGAGMRKTWWEQIQIPEFFKREKVDVAFFPYPSNPWTADWYKKGIKTAVTVHDCIPWMDKNYRRGLLAKLYHAQTRKAVAKADLVFTVSQASKKDIEKYCGAEERKIKVVYNDADDVYRKDFSEGFCEGVLKNSGLTKNKFFLYCGGYDVRKNVEKLIEQYSVFAQDYPEIALVLAGGKLFEGKLYGSYDVRFPAGPRGSEAKIVRTGFLEDKELAALYKNCLAFVNLSKVEGFNIPLLEAANCGAPLLLSDIEVHKEVAGKDAILTEVRSCAEKMRDLTDKKIQEEYRQKSLNLAKKYSWKSSAKKVKEMLF